MVALPEKPAPRCICRYAELDLSASALEIALELIRRLGLDASVPCRAGLLASVRVELQGHGHFSANLCAAHASLLAAPG
jgi:hypothetical protein